MTAEKAAYRVLVASASDKMASVVKDVLPGPQYRDISYVSTMGDAKRMLVSQTYDILIINTPLKDDFGIQAAVDIAEQHETGILLLVKAEMYEQVSSQVEDYGIVTLARPTTRQSLYTSVKMLSAVQMKIRKLEKEMRRMKERMQEQQTIDRAKWLLVDQRKMSEPDAHRYIEKAAMDRCVKKILIAEEILREN
mgnify:FL=1